MPKPRLVVPRLERAPYNPERWPPAYIRSQWVDQIEITSVMGSSVCFARALSGETHSADNQFPGDGAHPVDMNDTIALENGAWIDFGKNSSTRVQEINNASDWYAMVKYTDRHYTFWDWYTPTC
jgi:hypothetical protein